MTTHMNERGKAFLSQWDTEEEDKLEDEGVCEKLGPSKNKRKLVNLTF